MKIKLEIINIIDPTSTNANNDAWKLTDEIAYELKNLTILGKHVVFSHDGVVYNGLNKEHFIIFESNDDEDDE